MIHATDPLTGKVYSRRTNADYAYVSLHGGRARFHLTAEAARRAGGRYFPIDDEPLFVPRSSDVDVPAGATCTIGPSAVTGLRCGAPGVRAFRGSDGTLYVECADHITGGVS